MKKFELEFKISRDEEAKKAGEHMPVKVTVVADDAAIEKYMKKAATVWIQGQLRPNWDKFIAGELPDEVTLDVPIFAATRGVVTLGKATETLAKLDKKTQYDALLKGGILTQEQYDLLVGQLEG